MLNPLTHARTPAEVATYKVEPYVVAADVYTADGQLGRGGWTWYTGSASWMYRVGLEGILGLDKRGETLFMTSTRAGGMAGVHHRVPARRSVYVIVVRSEDGGGAALTIDGVVATEPGIPLVDDGRQHAVTVRRALSAEAESAGATRPDAERQTTVSSD